MRLPRSAKLSKNERVISLILDAIFNLGEPLHSTHAGRRSVSETMTETGQTASIQYSSGNSAVVAARWPLSSWASVIIQIVFPVLRR